MVVERTFRAKDRNGTELEFELIPPNQAAENEGERQFRVAFSKALQEGVFPREKLREIMREFNMWTEDDEKQLKRCVARIAILQIELKTEQLKGDQTRCLGIAKDISNTRRRMWELFLVQQTVYMHSAEGIAEVIKSEAIMASCTMLKASRKRYWENYRQFVEERDFNEAATVYPTVVAVQSRLLDEARLSMIEGYPEKQYLKDVQERMLEREVEEEVVAELKRRTQAALDAEANQSTPSPAVETPKPKRGRKKNAERVETKTDQQAGN
jgi:hypothetical protein